MSTETFKFQAESRELLDLMVHSIYSNKEIFLRELISNASDALDKLRIEALQFPDFLKDSGEPGIVLEADPKARTLTISDNGIGMSREEIVENIGTIAKSGTKEFLSKMKDLKKSESAELIGQFGVGFYSVFMIANQVTIVTRRAGQKSATKWVSDGKGEFTVSDAEKSAPGTEVTLLLKPADEENGISDYTDFNVVSGIVKRYSDFISYPITMMEEKEKKTLNSMKPIWAKSETEVKPEEYHEFYKHISHDWNEPLKVIPLKAEGTIEFQSLLFIPSRAPFDFYYQGYKSGLELYVRRVMIVDSFEDLLPHYLRFVKGVVESSDLPLNISREILQQDRVTLQMKKRLTKKVLDSLQEMLEKDRENYLKFWGEFGNAVKEGLTVDLENREKIQELLLFHTTADAEKLSSLKEYVARMKPEQKEIYYFSGENRETMMNSPLLEIYKNKGYEVILLTEAVDEIVAGSVFDYDGKKMKSIEKGDVELEKTKDEKKAEKEVKEQEKEFTDLNKFLETELDEYIKSVRLTSRLVSAPACVISEEGGMSPHLERFLKRTNVKIPENKRILELNPNHNIVQQLKKKFEADKADPLISEYAELLLGYAYLGAGAEPPDVIRFNNLLLRVMDESLK
ncbi:MAG: molecular chaperone HtpG [Spirochaetes bacterium GWF1_51_8]|nr:MAG: molecular chaperone HtpG [Spirochaetes bacterium GWF1_51_8]